MKNNIIKKLVNLAFAIGIIAVFTGLSVGQSDWRSLLNSNEINQTASVGKIMESMIIRRQATTDAAWMPQPWATTQCKAGIPLPQIKWNMSTAQISQEVDKMIAAVNQSNPIARFKQTTFISALKNVRDAVVQNDMPAYLKAVTVLTAFSRTLSTMEVSNLDVVINQAAQGRNVRRSDQVIIQPAARYTCSANCFFGSCSTSCSGGSGGGAGCGCAYGFPVCVCGGGKTSIS